MREGASADTTPTADAQAGDGVPATHAPLAAIRDEWLAPLVERIAEQAETIGRLEAERDAARAELAALKASPPQDAPHASPADTSGAEAHAHLAV